MTRHCSCGARIADDENTCDRAECIAEYERVHEWISDKALAALYRDARRYRWLRNESESAAGDTPTVFDSIHGDNVLFNDQLDAAIDEAMK